MKIPLDAIIAPAKLTQYLLRLRPRDDKSRLLGRLGFSIDAPDDLEAAIRLHARQGDALLDEQDVYGDHFVVAGHLAGPKGKLFIESVWVRRTGETSIRFVTLKPAREKR
jgi:hypothetical protein